MVTLRCDFRKDSEGLLMVALACRIAYLEHVNCFINVSYL